MHKLESIKEVAINILEQSEFRSSSDDTSQITDTPGLKPFTMLDDVGRYFMKFDFCPTSLKVICKALYR